MKTPGPPTPAATEDEAEEGSESGLKDADAAAAPDGQPDKLEKEKVDDFIMMIATRQQPTHDGGVEDLKTLHSQMMARACVLRP